MRAGVLIPQGWLGEYSGWATPRAFRRAVEVATRAEELGFESVWVNDHLTPEEPIRQAPLLESFVLLAGVASATRTIRMGHLVLCAGYRNPGMMLKMITTLDAASGGRVDLGLGAGWKRDDWVEYGYGDRDVGSRLRILEDHLEMAVTLRGPRTCEESLAASIRSNPAPVQEAMPIIVGGNGTEVTWRLAARYADELNVDGLLPHELEPLLPVLRSRCEEVGRDPDTLRVSAHYWYGNAAPPGPERVEHLAAYRALGVHRVMALPLGAAVGDEPLEAFADDALSAGVELG
ncbi:MAG: LLM class flavin-dependent oxidoreductase [bacterium]|nr:LLM class flavin-dependent oxidoreductase [bacterium]